MPTYSYACTECDHRFDAVQAFTDDALTTCPECTGRLRKLFNSVGVVFKGSGFYRTDSRGPAKGESAGGGDASGGSEKSGSTSGDAPAAKGSAGETTAKGSARESAKPSPAPSNATPSGPKPASSPPAPAKTG